MFCYSAFGLNILSQIEFPGMLNCYKDALFDVKIVLGEVNIPKFTARTKGQDYVMTKNSLYAWWNNIGKIKIKNNKIIVDPIQDIEIENELNIIPVLLGPVMALFLYLKGYLILHGSSVQMGKGAIAFLGYSKLGKSTLAINLYKKGYSLVTDDIIAITFNQFGSPLIYPSYPHIRLSNDSLNNINEHSYPICNFGNKYFVEASKNFPKEPIMLNRIYLLKREDKVQISDIKSKDSLLDLIRHSKTRISTPSSQVNDLFKLDKIRSSVPIRSLRISHSFENISSLMELIEADVIN